VCHTFRDTPVRGLQVVLSNSNAGRQTRRLTALAMSTKHLWAQARRKLPNPYPCATAGLTLLSGHNGLALSVVTAATTLPYPAVTAVTAVTAGLRRRSRGR
jgi:hypothetical protein